MIKLEKISKSYGSLPVLKDISLEVKRGEVVTLIGPSGSGKSTLLRCINLLELPEQGTLTVGNVSYQHEQKRTTQQTSILKIRRRIGMVFQHFYLFPHMRVLENLTYAPQHVLGLSAEEATKKGLSLLQRVGLEDKAHTYPAALSGGQKQRVAIARALAMEPEIMLFDEPTSALDPEMVKEVLEVMKELANQGMTMLVATHEMRFAEAVATRLLFLEKGEILEDTNPKQFFSYPHSQRAQAFLSQLV